MPHGSDWSEGLNAPSGEQDSKDSSFYGINRPKTDSSTVPDEGVPNGGSMGAHGSVPASQLDEKDGYAHILGG
jgi:hypothetical protein